MDKEEYFQKVRHNRILTEYCERLFAPGDEVFLDNNRILLIGGGVSPILTDLQKKRIFPKFVHNVDPFAAEQNDPRQKLFREDFMTWNAAPDSYDEVLALYSLPYYCETIDYVAPFYAKALMIVRPSGNLRVFPADEKKGGMANDYLRVTREFLNELKVEFPWVKTQEANPCGRTTLIVSMPRDKGRINEWLKAKLSEMTSQNALAATEKLTALSFQRPEKPCHSL